MDVNMESIERHKRRVGWFHWAVLFLGVTLMVYGMNYDAVVQEVLVHDSALIQKLQAERDQYRKERDDYRQLSAQLKAMVKASNVTVAQLTDQLKSLAVSVPSQPVILEVVRKEAVTEQGLRQVVARHFGADIAKRVRVLK